jgi:lipopolysaccharide/colanic/teichoic acid biosynthesis glycosyltransferase
MHVSVLRVASRSEGLYGRVFKRWLDCLLASVGLLFLSPLMLAAVVVIKIDSPRSSILYRGWRAGRSGQPFKILKFRTMVPDAEHLGGAETPDDDPRITRVGPFLRRLKIDELPQLFNVLAGEMSIVGPRPEVLEEVQHYSDEELQLLQVRPGITDWASIRFHHEGRITLGSSDPHRVYHEVIRPEKVRLGLDYVEHHSFAIDCRIILRTLIVIFE